MPRGCVSASWILDQYGQNKVNTTQMTTGKPVALGGSSEASNEELLGRDLDVLICAALGEISTHQNAGGITARHFECVQNNQQIRWEHDNNHRLELDLQHCYHQCRAFKASHRADGPSPREAAFALAAGRRSAEQALSQLLRAAEFQVSWIEIDR